jgi:hypothetical protein
MQATRAAVKQAKAVQGLEAKIDLILAHLGIEVPAESVVPVEETIAPIEAVPSADALQRSQLEENRQLVGSRGKPMAATKSAKPKAK